MAFVGKVLADGQLANAETVVYTVPASTTAFVKLIVWFNTAATSETVVWKIRPGATSRTLARTVLAQNETGRCDDSFTLETGDTLRGQSTNATSVDYLVFGVEQA